MKRKKHKIILFDSVRKEAIREEVSYGEEFPIDQVELLKSLTKTFNSLKREKRFKDAAYSVDFHIEVNGDSYIHRTSFLFVREGIEALALDLEKIMNAIEDRIEEVERKYKGSTFDLEDSTVILTSYVMYFKREMTKTKEKGRKRRLKKKSLKLKRSRPIRNYWAVIKSLRRSGVTLKTARRLYRKTKPKDRQKIKKTYNVKALNRIIGGLKRRKRHR